MRNQALLWLLWEGGLSVSEVCALRVGAVSLHQGIVRLSGPGAKERRIALGPEGQRALGLYLARLSRAGGKPSTERHGFFGQNEVIR
jgi:integrase/recombinase XerD